MAENCSYPFGIAIAENIIYYSDWNTKKVERIDKYSLKRLTPLNIPLAGSGTKLYDLVLVKEQCLQLSNVCYYYKDQCRPGYICMPNGIGSRRCVCASKIDTPKETTCNAK